MATKKVASALLLSVAGSAAAGEGPAPRPAIKTVEIGQHREFRVNGAPFFPIMLWLQSHHRIPDGLRIGVNTFCGNGGKLSKKEYLDELAQDGLYGIVHFKATESDGSLYVFAQNIDLGPDSEKKRQFDPIDPRGGKATITVRGLKPGVVVKVVGEGRTVTADEGCFTDEFPPLREHVYRLPM